MNISDLKKIGGIVSGDFVKKEVVWSSPEKGDVSFSIYVKKPSYADIAFAMKADENGDAAFMVGIIHRCVMLDDNEQIPVDVVSNLEPSLFSAISGKVFLPEKTDEKKPSRQKKSSGMS